MKKVMKVFTIILTAVMCLTALNPMCVSAATLRRGSRGTEVKRLQMNLNGLAYARISTDGIYGANTVSAVKTFQSSNGLSADGIAGNQTLNKIKAMVVSIQNDLNSLGYNVGTVDGIYGNGTKNAVKKFQRAYGLSADGIAGKNTRNKLASVKNNNQTSTNTTQTNKTVVSGYANTPSNVVTYSKRTSGNQYLSKNFKVKEFACKDGTDKILIDTKLVALLQDIRDHFGKAVIINSAYRTYAHNKSQDGAPNSKHLYGMAADIRINGVNPKEIAKYAESLGVKGIILYPYKGFVHVDTRTDKYWAITKGKYTTKVPTFK